MKPTPAVMEPTQISKVDHGAPSWTYQYGNACCVMCANQVHTVASGLLQLQIAGPDYSGRGYEAIPLSMSTFSSSIASAAIQGPVVVVGTADCDAPLQQNTQPQPQPQPQSTHPIRNSTSHNVDLPCKWRYEQHYIVVIPSCAGVCPLSSSALREEPASQGGGSHNNCD